MATAVRNNEELVRASIDTINEKDREAFTEVQDPEVVHHLGHEVSHGIEAVVAQKWSALDAFSDYTITPETIVSEGEMVATRWTATGTHEGEFNGIEPTGEEFEVSEMGMYRVTDGKIVEVWIAADLLGLLAQLGVVDPPT